MTACTERHTPTQVHDLAGEGQKSRPSQPRMTACTERHTPTQVKEGTV
jgi:hypothetical protein